MRLDAALPIDAVLGDLATCLQNSRNAVLVAPPGAGKTTRVPLALLEAPWLAGRKILVLEPRRLAARAAAERMARTLGEALGETVGLRARMASRTGPRTRIEVITEGVFTRMILDDPALEKVGAILFDEFHERSLDADLGLALALDAQNALREDLRLVVMSATLDGARVAGLLGEAPVIESEGRAFSVETKYLGRSSGRRIEEQMVEAILRALRCEAGSILAFLPGQGEIRRVEEQLGEALRGTGVLVAPLYGAMDFAAQERAIAPTAPGTRKVVLATAIAETSLTIEGVRIVVDCGLMRVPRYEVDHGVTRLETVRVSRASADQRRGRAGRTEPGICYRLWDEPQTQSLLPFNEAEIRSQDLSGLVLDCAEWGVTDLATLAWLDPPPAAALGAARDGLLALGALDAEGRITLLGRQLRALPLPPRLARMILAAATFGEDTARLAALIAALLVERGLGGNDPDLLTRLEQFRRDRSRRGDEMRRLASGWAKTAFAGPPKKVTEDHVSPPHLLALAFPDRIAKARGGGGQFLLASGRGAYLDPTEALARAPYLVVAEMQGGAAATRILLAAAATEEDVLAIAGPRVTTRDELVFDRAAAAVRKRRVRSLDALTLSSETRAVEPGDEVQRLLAEGVAALGIDKLPWSKAQLQLRDRVGFVRAAEGQSAGWPDLSDTALAREVSVWLQPFLAGRTRLQEISAADLDAALEVLLPFQLRRRLEIEAPTHFEAPTGNRHAIDYEGPGAPSLSIRVQELFGVTAHPAIANGRLPLTLNLLSPAHRPIQITRDLPGFWAGSWKAVKSEMKGRYPRHPWPDDPANAAPTARAKPRGS